MVEHSAYIRTVVGSFPTWPTQDIFRCDRMGTTMTDQVINQATDPGLMEVADRVFWEEFDQREYPGDRYIVIDSKNNKVVAQNVKLMQGMKKVRV